MVDPHQVIIDNGNKNSNHSDLPNTSVSLTQAMNEFDLLKTDDESLQLLETPNTSAATVNQSERNYQNAVNACIDLEQVFSDNYNEIMFDPSSQHGIEQNIQQNSDNIDEDFANDLINSASNFYQNGLDIQGDTDSANVQLFDGPNNEDIYDSVNNKATYESNDTFTNQASFETTTNNIGTVYLYEQTVPAASHTKAAATVDNNQIAHVVQEQDSEMDSRKVEPLRININRDSIKTIIKINANDRQQQAVDVSKSPSSPLNAGDDEFDDLEIEETNTTTYPKIKIKPVKPPENDFRHNHNAPLEAIPKLKIKKIDSTSSTLQHVSCSNSTLSMPMSRNNETSNNSDQLYHQHSASESYSVPKSVTLRNSANANSTIDSSSDDLSESASTSEVVPKLTIKLDNHQHSPMQSDSTTREVSLVSHDGVKVTLKPIAEPPLPKFTIKTNAYNDTAKVVLVENTSSEQTDESSDEMTLQSVSNQTSPNDKISSRIDYPTHRISSTSSPYQSQNIDDNLSTCSSGSSSSYSSSSSTTTPNNDIKLIIKATSTGSCVVSPNVSSISRNSPSSMRNASGFKASTKTVASDQTKTNNVIVNAVTSSNTSASDATIPKLNIKLSNADYPQVIHNDETDSESARTASPLPKLTIRMQSAGDDNIVIPKVTIKPVINPNESSNTTNNETMSKVTPKIILKPIPKPIDKPLEIITSPGSPFRAAGEHESQQSPRIILKINKNASSQCKESKSMLSSTTIITEEPANQAEQSSTSHNDNKRTAIDSMTQRQSNLDDGIVQLLSSDSDSEEVAFCKDSGSTVVQADVIKTMGDSIQTSTFDSNSGLRSILTRPQKKIQPLPLQNFLQAITKRASNDTLPTRETGVVDLCQDSSDFSSSVSSTNNDLQTSTIIGPVTNETRDCKDPTGKRNSNWLFLNNENAKEQPALPIHPLVQYDTERANILAAMMEADKKREEPSNGSNSNMAEMKCELDEVVMGTTNVQLENDGSSSDCIMIEDKSSESCRITDYNAIEASKPLLASGNDGTEELTPAAKRPRGRPRKTPAQTDQPASAKTKSTKKKQLSKELSKRKIAAALLLHQDEGANAMHEDNATAFEASDMNAITDDLLATPSNSIACAVSENLDNSVTLDELSREKAVSLDELPESQSASSIISSPLLVSDFIASTNISPLSNDSKIIITASPTTPATDGMSSIVTTPSTSIMKDRKRRIVVDDDDESPTFNPLRSNKKSRGKNSRSRKSLLNRKHRKIELLSPPLPLDRSVDESMMFTSPESIDLRKGILKDVTPCSLQVFEEDTQMSADLLLTSPTNRTMEIGQNDESQSSLHSSTSANVDNSIKKIRSKIEVVDPEGRTEFTVDLIAEYDWPPPKGCCPSRQRDAFMIQEQIAEYLGVKSFKRKYPDLPRRMVEMEERNYLMEKQLVSEKMCDLGLTAVLASDVLDIMHTDFYEKYDEYRRYARERQLKELAAKQKQMQAGSQGKGLSARENAVRAASLWNSEFNRSRKENRRECLDLQSFVIQTPEAHRTRQKRQHSTASNYPIALVPGQFQESYRQYSAAELLCFPLNTALANPHTLDKKLRDYYEKLADAQDNSDESDCDSDCSDCSSSSDSSGSSDDSSESMDGIGDTNNQLLETKQENGTNDTNKNIQKADKDERKKCRVCHFTERSNSQSKPEIFIDCSNCRRTAHPSCLKMSTRMVRRVNEYAWQCNDCVFCIKCRRSDDNDKIFRCDQCDRSYHIYCVGQRKIPEGKWHCTVCTICTLCGARRPEGHNNPNLTPQQKQKLLAVAKWTHEYCENPVTKVLEHQSMLCTSCVALKNSSARNIYFS